MNLTSLEQAQFSRVRDEYLGDDEGYRALQNTLLDFPERGKVIPGCGGLRKVRWADARRSKGTRGGLRIIYLFVPTAQTIIFIAVYDKDEMEDLTEEQKRRAATLANTLKEEVLVSYFGQKAREEAR